MLCEVMFSGLHTHTDRHCFCLNTLLIRENGNWIRSFNLSQISHIQRLICCINNQRHYLAKNLKNIIVGPIENYIPTCSSYPFTTAKLQLHAVSRMFRVPQDQHLHTHCFNSNWELSLWNSSTRSASSWEIQYVCKKRSYMWALMLILILTADQYRDIRLCALSKNQYFAVWSWWIHSYSISAACSALVIYGSNKHSLASHSFITINLCPVIFPQNQGKPCRYAIYTEHIL